jgi:hypothetical protein
MICQKIPKKADKECRIDWTLNLLKIIVILVRWKQTNYRQRGTSVIGYNHKSTNNIWRKRGIWLSGKMNWQSTHTSLKKTRNGLKRGNGEKNLTDEGIGATRWKIQLHSKNFTCKQTEKRTQRLCKKKIALKCQQCRNTLRVISIGEQNHCKSLHSQITGISNIIHSITWNNSGYSKWGLPPQVRLCIMRDWDRPQKSGKSEESATCL